MKRLGLIGAFRKNRRLFGWGFGAVVIIAWLLLYKLGSLTGGLSQDELAAVATPIGWHGLYSQPLELPLKAIRSIVFFIAPDHGQMLSRLPNAILGAAAAMSYWALIRMWYGGRIALLAIAMFASAAWTLHVGRLASTDVVYLWALPALLLSHFVLRKYYRNVFVWLGSMVLWGILLYVPGLVWFVVADIVIQRRFVAGGWRQAGSWLKRLTYVFAGLVWLPLLIVNLRKPGNLATWLGLPQHFESARLIVKHFAAVPAHLFVRGPEDPQLWLGKAPILDVFALAACVIGIYFYISHWKSARSGYLAVLSVLGFVLVGLGGPVPISLLVPLLYVAAATGLAYLLRQWLKTFPNNPLARGLGLGLIIFAVALSCLYNYRAYFIAWPHTATAKTTFQYRMHP